MAQTAPLASLRLRHSTNLPPSDYFDNQNFTFLACFAILVASLVNTAWHFCATSRKSIAASPATQNEELYDLYVDAETQTEYT